MIGFYFDQNRCLGCKTCVVACKDQNDLPVGVQFRYVSDFEVGQYPNARGFHYAGTCNHCKRPACVASCPTGAMYKNEEDGAVLHDDNACIGCESCVHSCPYGVPQLRNDLGIVQKCDSCAALRAEGENPRCVDACAMRALDFGELSDLEKRYGAGLIRDLPFLPTSGETDPSLLINAKEAALSPEAQGAPQ